MSPGRVKPGRLEIARFAARPTPNSCIPPHQTGTPARQADVVDPLRLAEPADAG